MNFTFSKSQQMLQKSARDFLRKECQDAAREAETSAKGFSSETWQKIAELGWLGIGIPEEYGGIDGDFFDLIILLQEMGRVLFPGPFIPSTVCVGQLINEFGTEEQKGHFLLKMTTGDIIVSPALHSPHQYAGEFQADRCEAFRNNHDRFILSGSRVFVPYASSADYFLFPFDICHDRTIVFNKILLVDSERAGINWLTLQTIAADKQSEVILDRIVASKTDIIGEASDTQEMLNRAQDISALAYSAYILGMLEKVLEMTVEYAKQRVQFGKPIGQFQAIQHQCADMMIDVEQVRNLVYQAGWKFSQGNHASKEISMAKARASDASRNVCLLGVKIHGGIGIIDEYDLQLYFRHAKAMELASGDADLHRDIVATELGL